MNRASRLAFDLACAALILLAVVVFARRILHTPVPPGARATEQPIRLVLFADPEWDRDEFRALSRPGDAVRRRDGTLSGRVVAWDGRHLIVDGRFRTSDRVPRRFLPGMELTLEADSYVVNGVIAAVR